jgi:phosphatidylserine decarboxylase
LIGTGAALPVVFGVSDWVIALSSFLFASGLFTLHFFRDPRRTVPSDWAAVVAPADGVVVGIEDLSASPYYEGSSRRISIFLSVFDVHVNRSPVEARVVRTRYRPGRFRNAMNSATSEVNESNTLWLESENGPVVVRQISGLIARRIVSYCDVGDRLAKGEKFGMIKFGSRTELYLPRNAEICVKLNEHVRGGATIVARFPNK